MLADGERSAKKELLFDWRYPHGDAAGIRSKYSVTALNHMRKEHAGGEESRGTALYYMADSSDETREDAGLSAAERGTALHRAFQWMDFGEAYARRGDAAWFAELLDGLVSRGVMSREEADSVGADALMRFANTELCRKSAEAGFVLKELPFNMRTLGDAELSEIAGEEIIVQGVIDCLIEARDGLVLVDYKSGHFDPEKDGEEARILDAYAGQIALYRQAAESLMGRPVTESLIYMTKTGTCIRA